MSKVMSDIEVRQHLGFIVSFAQNQDRIRDPLLDIVNSHEELRAICKELAEVLEFYQFQNGLNGENAKVALAKYKKAIEEGG